MTGERLEAVGAWVNEWVLGILRGMQPDAAGRVNREARNVEDAFLLACFADAFGVPSPVSYYTAELLPYLAEDFESWERRMWDRGLVFEGSDV